MSIATEISRIKANVQDAFEAAREKGSTFDDVYHSDDLPEAIRLIPNMKTVTGVCTLTSDTLSVSLPIPAGALFVSFMPDTETANKILSSGTYHAASFAAVNIYQERIFSFNAVVNILRSDREAHSGLYADFSAGLSLSVPSYPFISGSYIYTAYYGGDAV